MTFAAVLACATPAGAAIPLGQITAGSSTSCADGNFLQSAVAAGEPYVAPSAGVITTWQSKGLAATPGTGRLQVWRAASAGGYALVARSAVEAFTASAAPAYPTQLPVAAGDVIGLRTFSAGCKFSTALGGDVMLLDTAPDPNPGDTLFFNTSEPKARVNVAATLEPDADCDGLGDETQDPSIDPTGCSPPPPPQLQPGDSTPPDTEITAGPKRKSKNRKASFSFSSTEPGSSFECKLDGGQFESCSSPLDVKVKKGKHTFSVRAIDAAGNVDATPAAQRWKLKKKKKKR